MNKYCRLCWNTHYWREPTGEARQLEGPKNFVAINGFGHEEWLFNFSRLQKADGENGTRVKYGFMQPIGRSRAAYVGQTFDVLVYSIAPSRTRVAIASIRNVYVPERPELKRAIARMRTDGCLAQMRRDLRELDLSVETLATAHPENVINVRFDPSDVTFFDPHIPFPADHKVARSTRYQAMEWDDNFPALGEVPRTRVPRLRRAVRRSEADRRRAAIAGTTYSPAHNILQNAVDDYLCRRYGAAAVGIEDDHVDIKLMTVGGVIFFELKTATTAKGCIREALGQILEYASYPTEQRAVELIVVGDAPSTLEDASYLAYLRRVYRLPLFYQQWNYERGELLPKI